MGFELRKGISFCEVSNRLLFLDTGADRYFCLQACAEHAFRGLLLDKALDETQRLALAGMLKSGALIETPGLHAPCAFRFSHPTLSLLETKSSRPSALQVAGALGSLISARLSLRWGHLHPILQAIDLGKISWPRTGTIDLVTLQEAATAFEVTSRILRSHDKCLSRSIALARWLAGRGLPADLVIGVKMRPFAAHAWVQSGRWLVNDRLDNIRAYTPIMAA